MKPKRHEDQIKRVLEAWRSLRPEKSFAGMTLAQFEARIKASFDARAAIAAAELALKEAMVQRANADRVSLEAARRVVAAVIADSEEGDNSALYSEMGYVRRNDRASGLVRKKRALAPAMAEPVNGQAANAQT